MPASTTMTIRISADVKAKLGRLAQGTRRSRSFLASEAVETYVDRELKIIDGSSAGLQISLQVAWCRMTRPWPSFRR